MGFEEFALFYRQTLNFTEQDFFNLLSILEKPLPSSLRITDTPFKHLIEKRLSKMRKSQFFTNVYEAPRHRIPNKKFIINQTKAGHIQRQEVVSMLPVLLMGMEPSFSVLDMCAAPGSKTKQLLEIINDKGLVVCNEVKFKRMRILVSETCKIPRRGFMVLRHDASTLPVFKKDFDRVLCDVPCSGDGTTRKNYGVVPNWCINNALSLCKLQFSILKNAVNFVKDDGLIVYSTCSLNPIENECIIQKAVLELDLEIVDLRNNINEKFLSKKFKFREGLTKWNINIKNYNGINFEPVNDNIGLSKCIRVFPHDQNTGGFFITGLKKKIKSLSVLDGKNLSVLGGKNVSESINIYLSEINNYITENTNNLLENTNNLLKNDMEAIKNNINSIENDIINVAGNNIKINEIDIQFNELEECISDLKFNKIDTIKNKKARGFSIISDELREALSKEYNIKDKILVQKKEGSMFIYEVSQEVLEIMNNKNLTIDFYGYKLFEKNNLNESGYMLKAVPKESSPDFEISQKQLADILYNGELQYEYKKGSIIVLLKDFNIMVSGHSNGDHITLNINYKLQRALKDYIK